MPLGGTKAVINIASGYQDTNSSFTGKGYYSYPSIIYISFLYEYSFFVRLSMRTPSKTGRNKTITSLREPRKFSHSSLLEGPTGPGFSSTSGSSQSYYKLLSKGGFLVVFGQIF